MKKLEHVANNYIENQTALKAFLKYCKVHCGWFPYSQVNPDDVKDCLVHFREDHSEYAQFIDLKI